MPTNAQDYWRYLTVGQAANPPETGPAATTHLGVKLPTWAVSMSRPQAAARGYAIDPHGWNPKSWFQDPSGKWFYAGDPSMKMQGGRAVDVQNAIEWRVKGQGEGGQISPPGGWKEPSLADVQAPFQTGPPTGSEEFGPTTWSEPTSQAAYEPQPGASPSELPSPGVEQVANQFQEPNQFQAPAVPEPTAGGDFGNFPGPTPSELPSPSEIPMFEPQITYPAEAPATPGANVPTNDQGMMPTGPNEFLPSEGANVPTFETPAATGPEEQFLPSDAGANIPTDEGMTADLAPDAFGLSELPAEPAPETFSYPDGTGGYTTLDASGNPVSDVASAPAQPGTPGKTTTFGQDLSADLSDLGTALGTATPSNTALTSASTPGLGGFGLRPSSFGGGAFWSPPGGSIGGTLGGSANAAFEQVPFWQRMMMRSAHQYRANRPYIGGGDAVARFAARMGPPPPRHQGLYSPAARAAAIANMGAAAGGGAQQGGGGGMDVGPGQARGPGGRAMSPV